MADFDSNFTVFIEKFKNSKGLVNATTINKAGIARTENPQYRRNLLAHAVNQGIAWSNGKHHTHNKYGIYLNKDEEDMGVEITFDPSVLNNPNIINLPPRRLKNGLNIKQIETWNAHKESWTYVYQLLCGVQIEGKINSKLLPKWYHSDLINGVSTKAEKLIITYKILKFGWSEFKEYFLSERGYGWSELKEYIISTGEDGYNDIFQIILLARSIYSFNISNTIDLTDKNHSRLNHLRYLLDNTNDPSSSEIDKVFSKFIGNNYDELKLIANDEIGVLGSDSFINGIFSYTENADIKKTFI